ncbi:ribonuclease P protein component 4 [Haloparvum alkalitolerans]
MIPSAASVRRDARVRNAFPVRSRASRMGIPEERIERLLSLAREAVVDGEFDRSREYVRLARRIAERNRCGLPRAFTRRTCDDCDVYLRPGVTGRFRTQPGHVVVRCLECGATDRYPF